MVENNKCIEKHNGIGLQNRAGGNVGKNVYMAEQGEQRTCFVCLFVLQSEIQNVFAE